MHSPLEKQAADIREWFAALDEQPAPPPEPATDTEDAA